MQETTLDYKRLYSDETKVADSDSLGAQIGRVCAILDTMRDAEGRSSNGRILAILSTDAEKLLALSIGLGAAEVEIPERFQV